MGTHTIRDGQGRVKAVLTFADVYQYKGFTFEMHHWLGPCKLNADLEPAARMGRKFWKVWCEWDKLTKEEQDATRIAG
jgi:hypothetical protein